MCTKPLKAFAVGETKNGKVKYSICSFNTDHVEVFDNKVIKHSVPGRVFHNSSIVVNDYIEIPCGHCLECRLEYSRNWANRCVLEASMHEENCFITLTYDDLNLPLIDGTNPETGEVTKFKTLVKKDLQLFIKRLRSRLDEKGGIKIRYFAAGEYGDASYRP